MGPVRLLLALLLLGGGAQAQTGIGTDSPDPSARLEVSATDKGFLAPRMTEAERDGIASPAKSLIIFNTDANCLQTNVGTPAAPQWECLFSGPDGATIASWDNCGAGNTTLVGEFTEGQYSYGSIELSYTGGNGGPYDINVKSTGEVADDLVATGSGKLAVGSGTITLTISGTPGSAGTAEFIVELSDDADPPVVQSCSFEVEVNPSSASVASLDCGAPVTGSFTKGRYNLVDTSIPYTGGNGGPYDIEVSSNGLVVSGNGDLAEGDDSLALQIGGTPTAAGTASFAIDIGGQSCTLEVEVADVTQQSDPLPDGVSFTSVERLIASVQDQDYLPYTAPAGPAADPPAPLAADGTPDPLVSFVGEVPATGISLGIPYDNSSGGAVVVEGYLQAATVPAALLNGGSPSDVMELSYPAQTLPSGQGTLMATLKGIGGAVHLRQLDINNGTGNDGKGVLAASFPITPDGTAMVDVRIVAVVLDREFGDPDHQFFYAPVASAKTGEVWLNNNLGADYSNINDAAFAPGQQATASNDHRAYGSLYQWGRYSDGHELIDWTSGTAGTPVNGTTATKSTTDTPGHGDFIVNNGIAPLDWRDPRNDNLWQGAGGTNNPCPQGFRVPTYQDIIAEFAGVGNTTDAYALDQRFTAAGYRYHVDGSSDGTGAFGLYWMSTTNAANAGRMVFSSSSASSSVQQRDNGLSVRCIKE